MADVLAKMTMYDDVLQCSNMKGATDAKLLNAGLSVQTVSQKDTAFDISVHVHRTLADKNRRKCNIVVSGLYQRNINMMMMMMTMILELVWMLQQMNIFF